MQVVDIVISGIGSMSFDWNSNGFGVSCNLCGSENATNRLSGDMPPGIPGYYCDSCHKIVCRRANEYYREQFKKSTKDLEWTVLFREGGTWSTEERNCLISLSGGVWDHVEHPGYLILDGHYSRRAVSKALLGDPKCTLTKVVGTEGGQLPFLPI